MHQRTRIALTGIAKGFGAAFVALIAACAGPAPTFNRALLPAAIENYTYVIGAGDGLNIIVSRNPELSMSVPVRPDGKISAPLVDEMLAQGKTSVQVARELEKQLAKYVRDPVVTVVVTSSSAPTASRCASSARRRGRSSCPSRR